MADKHQLSKETYSWRKQKTLQIKKYPFNSDYWEISNLKKKWRQSRLTRKYGRQK